jgi:predicted nucleic acid-binding protein
MDRYFVDTFYWVARFSPGDQWHTRVRAFGETLEEYHFHATDEVLTEFLAFYSTTAPSLRTRAVRFVRAIVNNSRITVVPQTHTGFLDALALHEAHPDKHYSLVDCVSMQVMRREGLMEALTNDHHFTQEGFRILFPDTRFSAR